MLVMLMCMIGLMEESCRSLKVLFVFKQGFKRVIFHLISFPPFLPYFWAKFAFWTKKSPSFPFWKKFSPSFPFLNLFPLFSPYFSPAKFEVRESFVFAKKRHVKKEKNLSHHSELEQSKFAQSKSVNF